MMRILLIVFFMCFVPLASAEVYLMVDKKTNEIKDMSPRNDAVLQNGCEKIILRGDVKDYQLEHHSTYYKYRDNRFVLNIKKLSDEAIAEEKRQKNMKRKEIIKKKMEEMAVRELEREGLIEREDE